MAARRLDRCAAGGLSTLARGSARAGATPQPSGALTISVSPEMPASVIRNLADPAASLGAEPPGFGPEPVVAKSGGLAAVTLAKLASLPPRHWLCESALRRPR